jgi:hypothetical protein
MNDARHHQRADRDDEAEHRRNTGGVFSWATLMPKRGTGPRSGESSRHAVADAVGDQLTHPHHDAVAAVMVRIITTTGKMARS